MHTHKYKNMHEYTISESTRFIEQIYNIQILQVCLTISGYYALKG